ncbi:hemicentin-1-like isoform X1 [Hippoglossus hippoglossus]|uniref:hemicentin-1-like isoform X1 n=1 Tax=Hippoglossus hippoglossus TaxID=8267 RepID=UPI00148E6BF2|nr:hemicentin-1-like isoform X1 [Hippoglossus hippoglossus]
MPPLRMLHLLMLMVLLCDADGTCPTEHNPLVLDPSEVISEYGSEVFLNCSSSHEDHDGMYWSNAESEMTVDDTFIPWTVTLSDWNVTAKCIIKMNASFDCSKDLEITLYKNPDMVSLFPLSYSVEETQYVLQCDVHDVAPVQNLTVKWYKDNEMIRTESFPNRSKTPVTESPQLIANVSRGDTGAKFRCEAQLDFGPNGPKLPIISATVVIFAQYAPELSDNTTDVYMSLTEGDNVTLSCDAEGNPPPHFHWTRDGVNMMENTMNLSVTQVNVSANYTCTASNHLGRTNKSIFIHVIKDVMGVPAVVVTTPVPRKVCPLTLTPGEVVVRFGDRASVNCSTSATDVSGISWEASVGGTGSENPPSFTWTVEKLQDWSLKPKCYITLRNNHRCFVEPNIKLYKTPDVVSVSAGTQGPMVEGVQYLLRCDIISVAPVLNLRVMWSMGEENYDEEMFNDTSVTPVNKTSLLRVTPTRDHNGALFRCHAELLLGPKGPNTIPTISSEPYTAVVHYKPMMQDCPTHFNGVEHYFKLEMLPCKADGNPPPTVHWYYEGKRINPSEPLSRAHSGKYTAAVSNELSSTNTSVNITFEYGPSFTCDDRYEVRENGKVRMECEPEGKPAPIITWLKDGEVMVFPQRWTKRDSGKYVLRAANPHGTANRTLYLDVLFAPEFREGNYSQEVTPGQNVTFACSAEGNPVPEIQWNFPAVENVRETTGGRQKNVSVTGATSTNAGVYICVATNKVGSVSRSVTLRMRGHRGRSLSILWWLLILCFLTLLLIVMITLCKRRKKHGQYSFISPAEEGSGIPLTETSGGDKA